MNARLWFLPAVGLLFALCGSAGAENPDLADLAPARTLAYLELHDPPALARELHSLIKGSYLQHPALLLANCTSTLALFADELNAVIVVVCHDEAFVVAVDCQIGRPIESSDSVA